MPSPPAPFGNPSAHLLYNTGGIGNAGTSRCGIRHHGAFLNSPGYVASPAISEENFAGAHYRISLQS